MGALSPKIEIQYVVANADIVAYHRKKKKNVWETLKEKLRDSCVTRWVGLEGRWSVCEVDCDKCGIRILSTLVGRPSGAYVWETLARQI